VKLRLIIPAMPLTRLTLRQIEAFAEVADTCSFSAASRRLGLSASAVSQLVAELEAVLGFKLFERSTRRVLLSSSGREYLPSAESMLRQARQAEAVAADLRARASGIVRVGAPQVLASRVLPAAIREYLAERPRLVIRLIDTPVELLVDRVLSGDLDLAVGPDRPTMAEVRREAVFDSPWVLWCAPDHPLAARDDLRWADLRGTALVSAGRDHEVSVACMQAQAPQDERITPAEVVEHMSTALGLAAQGLAATLAPAYVAVAATPLGLVQRRVLAPEVVRQVCLYQPAWRAPSPASVGFAEHLVAWLRQWAVALA